MPFRDRLQKQEYQRLWLARRRASYFAGKACVQCDSTEDLELDHIDPLTKQSHKIWSWRQERREAELKKCQVLCVECHREKSANEAGSTWRQGRRKSHRLPSL